MRSMSFSFKKPLWLTSVFFLVCNTKLAPDTLTPDCSFNFTLNTTGNSSAFPNTCPYLFVSYKSTGFSGLSLQLNGAADVNGSPGSFSALSGTTNIGTNPLTSTSGAYAQITATQTNLAAWLQVNLSGLTGTGQVTGVVYGYKAAFALGGGGGGGGLSVSGQYLYDGKNYYIGPNFQVATLPSAATYSWVNQGAATETPSGNGLILVNSSGSGNPDWALRNAAMSSATTLTTAGLLTGASAGGTNQVGVGFQESATGKLVLIAVGLANNGNSGPSNFVQVYQMNSPTSFNAAVYNGPGLPEVVNGLRWFQIQLSGGNIIFRISQDGITFINLYSQAQNAFFTVGPDHWFYGANAQSSNTIAFDLLSWAAH